MIELEMLDEVEEVTGKDMKYFNKFLEIFRQLVFIFRDNFNGPPRSKYGRKSSPPPPSRRDQGGRDRGGSGNRSRLPSYEEYIRSVTRGSNPSRSSSAGRSRDDDYLYERRNGRPSYERSVESFLRRTGEIRRYRR